MFISGLSRRATNLASRRILTMAGAILIVAGAFGTSPAATLGAPQAPSESTQGATAATGVRTFDSGLVFLGAGHYMRTSGTLDLATGQIAAQTRTRTITWFGGFHGAATIIFVDANDAPVYQTQLYRYGVDGTWIGRSDRTDAWFEKMTPEQAARVHRAYIFHTLEPDSFMTVLNKWVAAGKALADFVTSAASAVKVVVGLF